MTAASESLGRQLAAARERGDGPEVGRLERAVRHLADTQAARAAGIGLLARALEPYPPPRTMVLYGGGLIGKAVRPELVDDRIAAGDRRLLEAVGLRRAQLDPETSPADDALDGILDDLEAELERRLKP